MSHNATRLSIHNTDKANEAEAHQWNASDTLTWDGSTFRVGERRMDYADVANCVYPTIGYYPYYYQSYAPNKTEVAFKIVGKLLEKKLIEDVTVRKFIELVNEVAALI